MKIYKKSYFIIYVFAFVLLVIGLILGSIYDLNISKSIVNTGSTFGMICASFGEIPGWCMIGMFGVISIKSGIQINKKVYKILLIIFGVLLIGVNFYLMFADMNSSHNGFKEISNIWIRLLISFVIEALIVFIGFKVINTKNIKMLLWSLLILMLAFYIPLGITFITKSLVYRPRFRLICNGYEGYRVEELFKNWYDFKNKFAQNVYPIDVVKSDEFKSFPSGHSFVSMSSVLLFYIPLLNEKIKNKEWIRYLILVICVLYGLLIEFSRVLYGAHYLSDVTIGGLLAIIFSFAIPFIGYNLLKKKNIIE